MSEVVVRMKMPKSCDDCGLAVDGWCYAILATALQPGDLDFVKRPDWCPIICALPEQHGRLVDADALKEKKYHSNITHENAVATAEIDWAPTIIQATERIEA